MTFRARTLLIVSIAVVGLAVRAPAAILVPAGLTPGDQYHLVFVSSVPSDANFGGLAGADAFVQGLADAAGIGVTEGVTWQAILSDSTTSAISRFNPSAPIYNMNGDRVAVNGPALWGTTALNLENPIAFDENGAGSATILIEVWTGTTPGGSFDMADSDWLASSPGTFATAGSSIAVNTDWINGGGNPAENVPLSVFAASDLLTVPVPEPTTLVLALLGTLSLVGYAWRRRRGAVE